ncbi:hypothetical protein KC19_2G079100 [Ceratodon purpureus]|uniref:Uncharacterized protein n=1 Tax=Ceratodon purpureus TaxID=3225 RepID=A0A8T0IU06_CERPU|nr:hypothetical protein KC19_2G079100 [Ceratodon purpureus]
MCSIINLYTTLCINQAIILVLLNTLVAFFLLLLLLLIIFVFVSILILIFIPVISVPFKRRQVIIRSIFNVRIPPGPLTLLPSRSQKLILHNDHLRTILTRRIRIQQILIQTQKPVPPLKIPQNLLRHLPLPTNNQRSCQRLHTRQLTRLPIIHRIRSHQPRQQPRSPTPQLRERHLRQPLPRTIHHRQPPLPHQRLILPRHTLLPNRTHHHSPEPLLHSQLPQVPQPRQLPPCAPLGVTLPEIPHRQVHREILRRAPLPVLPRRRRRGRRQALLILAILPGRRPLLLLRRALLRVPVPPHRRSLRTHLSPLRRRKI